MNEIGFIIFSILVVLTFFGISISCIAIWFKSIKKTKEILKSPNEHWATKMAIYYGIFFTIFITFSVFISFVIGLALVLWSGNV